MALSTALEEIIVSGAVPAIAIFSLAFYISDRYSEVVSENLSQKEGALEERIEDEDEGAPGNIRAWSRAFQSAHNYRDIHSRSYKVAGAGSIAWFASYLGPSLIPLGNSPLGIPTETGLKILAILTWIIWCAYTYRILRKFGLHPREQETPHQLGTESDTD